MLEALKSGSTAPYSTHCNGFSWRVFTCQQKRVFCVNCRLSCVPSEACPGTALTLSPCLTPSLCQTHAAAAAMVSFRYSLIKYYPVLVSPITLVATEKTTLSLSFNISAYKNVGGSVTCAAIQATSTPQTLADISLAHGATNQIVNLDGALTYMRLGELDPDTAYTVYCTSQVSVSQ
jgi:hypothetical protein